jgi:hypothetical protein
METSSIVKQQEQQQEQQRVGSARDCVYVVLENGELYPVLYSTYEEARAAVLHKYADTLEEERQDCADCAWMRMASQVDVAENTDTSGQTKLYVEKDLFIIIQRYNAVMPK